MESEYRNKLNLLRKELSDQYKLKHDRLKDKENELINQLKDRERLLEHRA